MVYPWCFTNSCVVFCCRFHGHNMAPNSVLTVSLTALAAKIFARRTSCLSRASMNRKKLRQDATTETAISWGKTDANPLKLGVVSHFRQTHNFSAKEHNIYYMLRSSSQSRSWRCQMLIANGQNTDEFGTIFQMFSGIERKKRRTQADAPQLAKLIYNSNNYRPCDIYIYIYI